MTRITEKLPLLHKELSYKIVGCCMKIHREYGPHHNERIYHNLLREQFELNEISYKSKPKIPVYSRETGKQIGFYVPDFLIEEAIILEIKAQPFNEKQGEVQLLEYLKTTPYELGYLINFGTPSLYRRRIIYTNDLKSFLSDRKN